MKISTCDHNTRCIREVINKMSVISRVKRFFAQTISGYSEVMKESNPDWHLVAKRMMYDFRVFNAEICDIPSDSELKNDDSDSENEPSDNETVSQKSSDSLEWDKVSKLDFNINEFEFDLIEESPPKKGYERDSDYDPEEEKLLLLK